MIRGLEEIQALLLFYKLIMDFWDQLKLARNVDTPIDVLAELVNCKYDNSYFQNNIYFSLAENQNMTSELLIKLLDLTDFWWVKSAIAGHANTPEEILFKLSQDVTYEVRFEVCLNPNTPDYILKILTKDPYCSEDATDALIERKNLAIFK